ncbi:MAG: hypothetical protein NTY77_01090 [Elusimicrobia bacterium]|nr:hypothetical protein [Elusimicrobiota bacterium]
MDAPSSAASWALLFARLWFILRTLAVRGRFLTGKASFVRTHVRQTSSALAEVYDRRGHPLGTRRLAHHRLETDPPRTGMQGWSLFAAQAGPAAFPALPPLVRLVCGFCGHLYFIEIRSPEASGGDAPPGPASYSAAWFSFMDRSCQGVPALDCPHCEQSSAPGVQFLTGA